MQPTKSDKLTSIKLKISKLTSDKSDKFCRKFPTKFVGTRQAQNTVKQLFKFVHVGFCRLVFNVKVYVNQLFKCILAQCSSDIRKKPHFGLLYGVNSKK